MSVEKTKKVIRNFLLNGSPEVLSIKGDWGVGKTYFWKDAIKQAKSEPNFCRENYCYVSLFGITSVEQLKSTIFETYEHKSEIGNGFSWNNLMKRLPRYVDTSSKAISSVVDKFGYVVPEGVLSLLHSSTFHLVKNMLICIDDVERKGDQLLMKDVLGLISFLKEERNCKVALIFSDANLTNDGKEAYPLFREKVVDVEVKFAPTPTEAADIAFNKADSIDAQLGTFTRALNISNIRILRRIQKAACIAVPLLREFDPQITRASLQTLALFGWCYYSHKQDPGIPSYEYVTAFGCHLGRKKTEQQLGWDAILQEYNFKATDALDVALSSLIENGFVDEELVRKEAQKLNEQIIATKSIEEFREAWNLFFTFNGTEEELVTKFENSLREHVQYISPLNLNSVIGLLRELDRNELACELIDFYIEKRGADKEIFDISENLRSWQEEPDKELEHKFNLQLATLEETPTIEGVFAHLAKERGWGWSPAQWEVLASATADDFYRIFKSATRKNILSYLKASLQYGQLAEVATEHQLEITKKAKEALLRIGNESLLNKVRLKRFGISTEEDQVGAEHIPHPPPDEE